MVKRLQLARSPGKQEPETSCNYTELGVVMLPPSVSGVKCRFVAWCLLKLALKENTPLAVHQDTRGRGCRDKYQIK